MRALPARWRRYAAYYRGARRILVLTVVLSVAQSLLVVPAAVLIRRAFAEAIPRGGGFALAALVIGLVGLYLLKVAVTLVTRHIALSTTKDAIAAMRMDLLALVYALPHGSVDRAGRAGVHHAIVQDTERVDVMSNALIAEAAPGLVLTAALSIWLVDLNARLFVLTIAIVPPSMLAGRLIGHRVRHHATRFRDEFERFGGRTWQALRALDLARAHAAESLELERHRQAVGALRSASARFAWLACAYSSLQTAIAGGMGLVIIAAGGAAVARGTMSLGDLGAFYVGALFLAGQLGTIVAAVPFVIAGDESLAAIAALLARAEPPVYCGTRIIDFAGHVTLEDVSFGYGDRPVLDTISIDIPRHATLAVVGPNGSGKSTLARLLLGFHRPSRGRLLADGVPYDEIDMSSLRRSLGIVLQDPPMLQATVFDNIAYGATAVTRQEVERAAGLATADAFIAELPDGYDTMIGEDGAPLSAGQRQRLAVARALVRRPALLVFDEPTTHLDREAVVRLLANLSSLPQRPTVVLTTHDAEVARRCERVLALGEEALAAQNVTNALIDRFPAVSRKRGRSS